MFKDFSQLLAKGNFTPKERVLLLVNDIMTRDEKGKGILSEADKHALTEGWTPTSNLEAEEYNRWLNGWKTICFAESDAQTIYLEAKVKKQTLEIVLVQFSFYPAIAEAQKEIERLKGIKKVSIKEAVEITEKQRQKKLDNGLNLEMTITEFAFYELVSPEARDKILNEYHHDDEIWLYLNEEVELTRLLEAKDFEAIADKVSQCYNQYAAEEYQLWHDYANITAEAIAKRYAKSNNLPFKEITNEDEGALDAIKDLAKTLKKHADENKTTVEAIIKDECLKWLNEGMLDKDFIPMAKQDPGLFKEWTEARQKAEKIIRGLIDEGKLKTKKDEDGELTLTGESIYNSGLDYKFIKDFKEFVDEYNPDLGLLYDEQGEHIDSELLISNKDKTFSRLDMLTDMLEANISGLGILKEMTENGKQVLDIREGLKDDVIELRDELTGDYAILLGFAEFFKRASRAYEMDLTFRIELWTNVIKETLEDFNNTLLETLTKTVLGRLKVKPLEGKIYKDNLFIDIDAIKPDKERVKQYEADLIKLLGSNFNALR